VKNRITTRNEHQPSARSRWFNKRSQAARVLLSGWFFFWIVGVVQPCCIALADADDHAVSQAMSMDGNARLAGAAGSTSHPNEECPLAFTADVPLPSQDLLLAATTDFTPHLVAASPLEPLLAVADFSNPLEFCHPSPPPRIYLRTQRLRI
jgi:hypothetical protein